MKNREVNMDWQEEIKRIEKLLEQEKNVRILRWRGFFAELTKFYQEKGK